MQEGLVGQDRGKEGPRRLGQRPPAPEAETLALLWG